MRTLYSREKDPEDYRWSIFLVGPTPRHPEVPSWRPEMLSLLEEAGFGLWVRTGRLRYGAPPNRPKNTYLNYCYRKYVGLYPALTMRELVRVAIDYFLAKGPEFAQAFKNTNFTFSYRDL